MPVAIVVGGTPKLFTIPPSATGSEATLNDMIICPSAIAIIGTQDAFSSDWSAETGIACTDMPCSRSNGGRRDANPCVSSNFSVRDEEIHPQALGEKFRSKLPLDAVARGIEPRRKGPEPALAWRDGNDTTANPTFSW